MKKYILLSLLLMMMLCSCMTDYILTCTIEFQNNSSHVIHFTSYMFQESTDQKVIKYTIPIGESLQLFGHKRSTKYDRNYFNVLGLLCENDLHKVRFGESVEVTLLDNKYQEEDTYKRIGKSKYRYTFTDADYQFALENGTVLE